MADAVWLLVAVLLSWGVAVSWLLVRNRREEVTSVAAAERATAEQRQRLVEIEGVRTRLAEALAGLEDGIVVVDARQGVLLRNPGAEALIADPAGGALVRSTVEMLTTQALDGVPGEKTLDLFGPPRRALRVAGDPLRAHGRITGAVVVIEDVSERRRLESVRRDFVANISHELKTPVGALGLLAETMVDEHDLPTLRRLASRMSDEAIRVGRIIDDLLDLSRIEAEEAPRRDPIAVDDVVAEAADRLQSAADQQGVSIEVRHGSEGVTVVGDRRQLVSALHSLMENAITYTDEGGSVRVGVTAAGGVVRITVEDTGVGIPARDLDRIFERFYRVDRARARATGGTGLGLSIVNHVATNHGGHVHVQSQEGAGSIFTLELPAGPSRRAPVEATG